MSDSKDHIILDRPSDPEPPSYNWLNYVSLGLLLIGVFVNSMGYPEDKPILVLAFSGMLIYGGLHFFRKKRPAYAWCYFAGRLVLTAGILLSLFRMTESRFAFVAAMIFFALGIIFSKKKDPKAPVDSKEAEEEDMLM